MKWLLLFIISLPSWAQIDCEDQAEGVIFKKFIPTNFDTASERRTLDVKFSDAVKEEFDKYQSTHPEAKISRVDVFSCTSTFPLSPASKSSPVDPLEHINLAEKRKGFVENVFANNKKIKFTSGHGECGPKFVKEDLNLRFRVVIKDDLSTQKNYDDAIQSVLSTPGILEQFQEYLGIGTAEEIKNLDPNPFKVKYRFFEGYRLLVYGKDCSTKTKIKNILKPKGSKI